MRSQCKLVGLLFLLVTFGCAQNTDMDIAGNTFQSSQNAIAQTRSAFLDDGAIKIGIVSDIEGSIENAQSTSQRLKSERLDAIIIAGDVYENEQIRRNPLYPNSTENIKELVKGISPYAELGVPVFVIPGNHETKTEYAQGINELRKKHQNMFDITSTAVDAQGVNIVGIGGYHDRNFIAQGGFQISDKDYARAKKAITKFELEDDIIILVTHSPPRTSGKIDYVQGTGNVGDSRINELLTSSKIINVHGHIHEGGGNTAAVGNSIAINVASITSYNNPNAPGATVITISNGTAGYKFIS